MVLATANQATFWLELNRFKRKVQQASRILFNWRAELPSNVVGIAREDALATLRFKGSVRGCTKSISRLGRLGEDPRLPGREAVDG